MLFLIVVVGILAVVALNQISSLRRDFQDLNSRIGKMDSRLVDLAKKFRIIAAAETASAESLQEPDPLGETRRGLRSRPTPHVASLEMQHDAPALDDTPAPDTEGDVEEVPP
jgi:hypothetical protein